MYFYRLFDDLSNEKKVLVGIHRFENHFLVYFVIKAMCSSLNKKSFFRKLFLHNSRFAQHIVDENVTRSVKQNEKLPQRAPLLGFSEYPDGSCCRDCNYIAQPLYRTTEIPGHHCTHKRKYGAKKLLSFCSQHPSPSCWRVR